MTSAEIACWSSHREVWHDIASRRLGTTLVLEDDVDMEIDVADVLQAAIQSLPDDWAIVWLGHCFEDLVPAEQHVKVGHRCVLQSVLPF